MDNTARKIEHADEDPSLIRFKERAAASRLENGEGFPFECPNCQAVAIGKVSFGTGMLHAKCHKCGLSF